MKHLPVSFVFCLATVVFWSAGPANRVQASNIPVFRYALERWNPDACQWIVFYHSALRPEDSKRIEALERRSLTGDGRANVRVLRADVAQPLESDLADLWLTIKKEAKSGQPWLVARTPVSRGRMVTHWHGPLQEADDAGLLQSPVRTQLIERLQSGHAVVWLMLKSADPARNQQVEHLLQQQFERLSNTIELPEGIGLPGSELFSEVPLLLRFSILQIDPQDAQEQFLIRLFTGFQPEAVRSGEPLVIPVFGRGRALEVIPANKLSAGLVEDLTVFLCGACSCQVKELNPGFDLLLMADWNTALFGEGAAPPPAREEGGQRPSAPVLLPIPPGRSR